MQRIENLSRKFFESRFAIHIAFIVSFLMLFSLPSVISDNFIEKFYRIILYETFLLVCVYAGRWSCKNWLLSKKYGKFILYSFLVIIILTSIGIAGSKLLTNNGNLVISFTVFFLVFMFYLFGLFVSLTRNVILQQLKEHDIVKQQTESELRLLKSQLSPHFIFNVLNNIYGISRIKTGRYRNNPMGRRRYGLR